MCALRRTAARAACLLALAAVAAAQLSCTESECPCGAAPAIACRPPELGGGDSNPQVQQLCERWSGEAGPGMVGPGYCSPANCPCWCCPPTCRLYPYHWWQAGADDPPLPARPPTLCLRAFRAGYMKLDFVAPVGSTDPIAKCLTSIRMDLSATCEVGRQAGRRASCAVQAGPIAGSGPG